MGCNIYIGVVNIYVFLVQAVVTCTYRHLDSEYANCSEVSVQIMTRISRVYNLCE
jgi:hypothetical protein